mgnify:CR=1 FL=1
MPTNALKVFISYRRDDSGYVSDSIYTNLCALFGAETVFFDVDGIPPGVNWKRYLRESVEGCQLMLVVIGRDWLEIRDPKTGERRLEQPTDFVRFEIELALQRGIPIIPLFLDGLTSVAADRLPASMAELADFQGLQIRRLPDFERDMERLHGAIERLLRADTPTPTVSDLPPPPFAWIDIPAGRVTLHTWDNWEDNYVPKGKQGTSFDVPAFSIAKYPVTNAQFQVFIDADDGYRSDSWWDFSPAARAWRAENRQPRSRAFPGDDHPRANMSWYEAVAFCRWLSARTVEQIMLPSEQQWQRAAQGDTNWAYAYGDTFDRSRCNFNSQGTTPVTQFEGKGDSPFGVVDMSGNVWEWCSTAYHSGSADLDGTEVRVLRGGSWRSYDEVNLRVDYRGWNNPGDWDGDGGFRLIRS